LIGSDCIRTEARDCCFDAFSTADKSAQSA
jgi:hypothetical protein